MASLPSELDAAWWRQHAHLVRDPDDYVVLSFRPGTARDVPEPDATPGRQDDPACADLAGQERRVANLRGVAEGARALGRAFPHVLLAGPERTQQATLARIIAAAAAKPLVEVAHPGSLDRLAAIGLLAGLAEGTVLFVEEAQALPLPFLAVLLEALARGQLALELSDGRQIRRFTLRLPTFTLVAGTPDEWAIPAALRACFGLRETLPYDHPKLTAKPARPAPAERAAEVPPSRDQGPSRTDRGAPREARPPQTRTRGAGGGARRRDLAQGKAPQACQACEASSHRHGEQRDLAVWRSGPTLVPVGSRAHALDGAPLMLGGQMAVDHVERGFVRWTPQARLTPPHPHRPAFEDAAPGLPAAPCVPAAPGLPAAPCVPAAPGLPAAPCVPAAPGLRAAPNVRRHVQPPLSTP